MSQTDVSLFLAPRAPLPETDRARLAVAVGVVCRVGRVGRVDQVDQVAPTAVVIEQRCERCGGAHGRPRVLWPPGVYVSLSRSDKTVVVAVSLAGPVGVDIESFSAIGRAGFDDVAFNAHERDALQAVPFSERDRVRATLWTSKEALLKLSGAGLTVDPREVTVGWRSRPSASALEEPTPVLTRLTPTLLSWPTATIDLSQVHLSSFDAGGRLVGTVAVLGSKAPRIQLHPET